MKLDSRTLIYYISRAHIHNWGLVTTCDFEKTAVKVRWKTKYLGFRNILSRTETHLTKWVLLRFKFWNQFWVSLIALYKSLFFVFFLKKKLKKQNWKYFFFSKKNWKKLKCIKIFRWIFFFRKNIFYFKFLVFVRPTYKGTCIPNISKNHKM